MSKISEEIMMDQHGNKIGVKELHNEVIICGSFEECVTKEIVKLHDGKIVFDYVIYRTQWNRHGETVTQESTEEQIL